jgi:tetratricopeptide (TPR) repeat protein
MQAIQKRMEEGLALFVAEKPLEAAKVFEQGYQEHPYSAFLFNAGICYEKIGKNDEALAKYKEYMRIDPNSPDIADIRSRVAKLEGTAPAESGPVKKDEMRSLVVVESDPTGAPVRVFRPTRDDAPAYRRDSANPDWTEIVKTSAPTSLSLGVGRYQIVIDKFGDFNASDTELRVSPGHVHHFRANLSQGVFMAFLRVSGNVKGAHVYLNDAKKAKPEWGSTPYGELVPGGEHEVLIEKPGFQPIVTKVLLDPGQRKELEVSMVRVDHGIIRLDADVDQVSVTLDGKPVGSWSRGQPGLEIPAPAGRHALVVSSEDRKDFEGEVTVPKGQVLPVRVTMIPKFPRGTAWTQAVLSGACLGAGIYFGLESERLQKEADADRQRGVLDADDSRLSTGYWFAIGADVGFGASAVLGGLSVWNFVRDPLPESSHEESALEEFNDPLSQPAVAAPKAPASPPKATRRPARESERPTVEWHVLPTAAPDVAGISIGGTF